MSIVELCQGKESSIYFFAGSLYTSSLIPINLFLGFSLAYLTCTTPPLYSEPPNEPVSPSEQPHYPDPRRNSHPHRESLDHPAAPELEVADLDLEATGLET